MSINRKPGDERSYQAIWLEERRNEWFASKGGKCVICQSTENLEVDHIDPALKTMEPNQAFAGRAGGAEELERCQPLCRSCHLEKTTYEMSDKNHGTRGYYRKMGCRCDLCRAHNAAMVAAHRAKNGRKLYGKQLQATRKYKEEQKNKQEEF